MTGEVAAVHGGNVPRFECRPRLRVVPVEQMPPVLLERLSGLEGGLEQIQRIEQSQPTEVMCGDGGDQRQPNVRRRGPMRDDGLWDFLEIVRRQKVILDHQEALEVMPGAAGDQPQRDPIIR